jgi:photosystem II stability/assembly factor-like uncharacterized protein
LIYSGELWIYLSGGLSIYNQISGNGYTFVQTSNIDYFDNKIIYTTDGGYTWSDVQYRPLDIAQAQNQRCEYNNTSGTCVASWIDFDFNVPIIRTRLSVSDDLISFNVLIDDAYTPDNAILDVSIYDIDNIVYITKSNKVFQCNDGIVFNEITGKGFELFSLESVYYNGTDILIYTTEKTIFKTSDNWVTVDVINIDTTTSGRWGGFIPLTTGVLYSYRFDSGLKYIYRSVDGGGTWVLLNPSGYNFGGGILTQIDENSGGVYVGTFSSVFISKDNGITWNEVFNIDGNNIVGYPRFSNDNNIIVSHNNVHRLTENIVVPCTIINDVSGYILKEDGNYLLQENGGKLIIEI